MARVVIRGFENGPYEVNVDGKAIYHLCRCGHSENKPYCDGHHKKVEFKAPPFELEITK
ncbi:iron-binding zinc finger protein [Nanobdella aerobiophila]|uniref:Iron-binding zinc finger protein n=1 Tax=Nanobdella aerobiophila TaxID=2586965 RepID=A0A915SYI5_9ARCH|nr:CDGSH iron-sulfur domain-containing protein [Nanobdella aerobiophila]BBL45845.1 iron-binding zinc finger protein [Nanobdella aerobiophila]